MNKKISLFVVILILFSYSFIQFSTAYSIPGEIYEAEIPLIYCNVTVYAPAVAQTDGGYVGIISTITVTVQRPGSGRVFVDTLPLTQIDMQGSARLAVKVASKLVEVDGIDADDYDFFFVVRTDAPIIGGPSAGGIMTVATVALLEGDWDLSNHTIMTGMINPDGSIGPVGGIPQKIDAANSVGAKRFLIPKGQGTYTEAVRTIENGWTVSKDVTKSVAEYAMDNYGIEVVEVEDVNEALINFTGYGFPKVESDKKISTEDYIGSMMPLASSLLEEAKVTFKNATSFFDNATITNRNPYYYKNQITGILNDAEDRLDESQDWYDQGIYYSSTSKSFQSLIDSRFVVYACRYFNSDDGDSYIEHLIDETDGVYENKSEEAKNAEINGMISLQCVGAAQKRVTEAATHINDAKYSYASGDILTVLYKIAFAVQRCNSVGWWLSIGSDFNDTGEINETILNDLVNEYIEDAQQSVTYSGVILQTAGRTSSYLDSAEELLDSARDDLENGYPAAALFESLEALAKANLAIENIDGDAESKIDRARNSTSASITESRNVGIEPVLAVSYYEYAESLVNESSFTSALIYYKYGNLIAGALLFTNFSAGAAPSRYIGIPEIKTSPKVITFSNYGDLILFTVSAAVGGGIIGLGIGLFVGRLESKPKKKKNTIGGKSHPQNIDNYYKRQRYEHFSKDEIPRSIKDYYKKNK